MKKELSPLAIGGIIAAAVAVIGFLGFTFMSKAGGTAKEDPDVAQMQLEVERARRPGGGGQPQTQAPAPTTAPGGASPGSFSPGRESEMSARQNSGQ
ncbi:MAG: hypothetical protein KDC26_09520 [Armatimonadetes bacterium]|nr:hypothetical protein [Armatimonadota bacterium]